MKLTANAFICMSEGKLHPDTRDSLAGVMRALRDGMYEVQFHEMKSARSGRYKYYFGYFLPTIMQACKPFVVERETGDERPASVQEFHDSLKLRFNSCEIIDPISGTVHIVGRTTTEFSDADFINEYEERICSEFVQAYPDLEVMSREEWTAQRSEIWNARKKSAERFGG
jgi:hypothetical protein